MIKLPIEILLEIFKYLDFKNIIRKKEINKMILKVVNSNEKILFSFFLLNSNYLILENGNNITFNRKNRSLSYEKNLITNIEVYKLLFSI